MKTFFFKNLVTSVLLFMLVACTDGVDLQENPTHSVSISKVLRFNSSTELSQQIELLKEADKLGVNLSSLTKSINSNFVSLRQSLIDEGLSEFTDADLQEITNEELIYEPEDSIITDQYLASVLNSEREIMIGDKMYKYIEKGLVEYTPTDENEEIVRGYDYNSIPQDLPQGERIALGNDVALITIDYNQGTISGVPVPNQNGSITLVNDVTIPASSVNRTKYTKENTGANWLQALISGYLGTNVTLVNEFDANHRMKLRMYNQDYILYRAVGFTVRMQQKTLGIWWRKKAQEFRYGWSAIEVEYKYDNPVFSPEVPPNPSGITRPKYPTTITKKFPYSNTDVVLFNIPIVDYDLTTGDINKLFATGLAQVKGDIFSFMNSNPNQKDNPKGLFTIDNDARRILVVYPQGEEVAYNEGRDVVRWELQWFSGNCVIGFSTGGNGWSTEVKEFSQAVTCTILRGQIYAAVKYNNEWKACIIETE